MKGLINKIDDKPDKYGKDFMKTKLNSEDNLNKILKLHMLTVIAGSASKKDG